MHRVNWELLEEANKRRGEVPSVELLSAPTPKTGEGLSNLDYAYIAASWGKKPLALETLNCNAPDTRQTNGSVWKRIGTPEAKRTVGSKPCWQVKSGQPLR